MDTSIVLRTKNGEVAAFTELYNHTHDKAFSVAYSILKDDFDAEDIVQEAYIVVMEKLDDLKNPDRFESWFYQIVRTRSLNELKKKRPTTFTNLESLDSPEYQFVNTVESDYKPFNPEAVVDEAETRRLVRDMVFSLPEMQKKCIIMRYQGDMKVCDIAKALNIPESTVKSNLNYGRKKIEESVRSMEQKGIKLYSVSPTLVLPLLREVLYMGLAAAGSRDDDSSKRGSVLAEAGKEGIRVVVRRAIAAICATFAIGGATVGLNNWQPTSEPVPTAIVSKEAESSEPATDLTLPKSETVPKEISVDSLVTVWKEGSIPGDIPNTYRLPALTLGYGSDSEFVKWANESLQYAAMNLDYFDNYLREIYQYEGELHFDYVSEVFGNVLVVMATVNDFPTFSNHMSICYDLTTGKKLTVEALAEYADLPRDYLEDQILFTLKEHWVQEDEAYTQIENIEQMRELTLSKYLWNNADIIIQPYCKGLGYEDPSYGSVMLCVTVCYEIEGDASHARAAYSTSGNEYFIPLYMNAVGFKAS